MRHHVPNLLISLPDELYDELRLTAADCGELDEDEVCSPEAFAREAVEAAIATRRLERITAAPATVKRALPRRRFAELVSA